MLAKSDDGHARNETQWIAILPVGTTGAWLGDWIWGLTLVTASLVMHALGLGLIGTVSAKCFGPFLRRSKRDRHPQIIFPIAIGVTSLMLAILHGLEASLWAAVDVWLGAGPDFQRAVYYSLQMITTLGSDAVSIKPVGG